MPTNVVIEELHQIRRQLLDEAQGDLTQAIKHAHQFAHQYGLPVVHGQPRRPLRQANVINEEPGRYSVP